MKGIRKIFLLSILVYIIAGVFSVGNYHADEHYQILEYAGTKLGLTDGSTLSWEYQLQIRSALQPGIAYISTIFLNSLGISSPFSAATFLRLLSAALSLLSIHLFLKAFIDKVNPKWKSGFAMCALLLWFTVFVNVRFSSENWAGTCFLIGISLLQLPFGKGSLRWLCIGMIFGAAFLFRNQVGLMIFGLMLWMLFIQKDKFRHLATMCVGILLTIGIGAVIDRWFYGSWSIPLYGYFLYQVVLGRAATFGAEPWWFYFSNGFIQMIPPVSLLFLGAIGLVFISKPKSVLTWVAVPFIVAHLFMTHKDIRFMFPLIPLFPWFIYQAAEIMNERWGNTLMIQSKPIAITLMLFWVINFAALAVVSLKPANNAISLFETVYAAYTEPITLYATETNPYMEEYEPTFYKRKTLSLQKLESFDDVMNNPDEVKLYITKNKEEEEILNKSHRLVYRGLPDWVVHFNINNWVARTRFWKVYEIRSAPNAEK
ncbi:MAG TPA: hypothetical protein EYN38_03250 [Flavobacteriales bacterium]|nr:hypothetical protein [Flavobacteriales bacterium]HIA12165.1 hypothetical protein [Flavobacteriales bacterium]HIO72103.1 hypothetical protein [Flavobacteriales bacterium]